MNYKLLLGLILLSIVILPYLPALAQGGGQFPTKITWEAETRQDTALMRVASGESDLFFWSVGLAQIPDDLKPNLTLIYTYSTYTSLVFNIAQNVIDPTAPGEVIIWPEPVTKVPGKYIPGVVLVDPDVKIKTHKRYNVNWTDINSTMYPDLVWNPLAIREIRFAINYLVDRVSIAANIYGGSAVPKYCAILNAHPQYKEMFKQICEDKYGFTYDPGTAKQIFKDAVDSVNNTLDDYGMYLDHVTVGGKEYLAFFKPDGSYRIVYLNFMIRTEDERLDIGRLVATEIENNFKIWVNKIEKPRPRPIRTAYLNVPVKRDIYGTIPSTNETEPRIWHIYTEGWVTTAEVPWHWLRWTITFFYLPLSGNGPNADYLGWTWVCNMTVYSLTKKLNYYTYTNETELKNDILQGLDIGIWEAIRVFIADELTAYPANRFTLTDYIAGYVGLSNPWAMRSLRFTKPEVKFLQFSTTGALFMYWWNPLTGFQDIYSENIHRFVADFDYWINPATGEHTPMRVESYKVVQTYPANISLANVTGYVYDPIKNKWVYIWDATKEWIEATYTAIWSYSYNDIVAKTLKICSYVETRYKSKDGLTLGKWHDGSDLTIADLLYGIAFSYEWSFNDENITGEADPFYWDEFYPAQGLYQYFGFKILNWTSMAYWIDYADVVPVYVADYADVFADMPWHLLYAGEEIIVNPIYKHDPSGYRYGWSTMDVYQAVDYIEPETTKDIKTALINIKNRASIVPKEPPYFTTYPDPFWAAALTADIDARITNAINFIDKYGHSYVSQGPFYVDRYDPTTFIMIIKQFPDYQFSEVTDYIFTTVKEYITIDLKYKYEDKVFVLLGDRLTITMMITVCSKYPRFVVYDVDLTQLVVKISIYHQNGTYLGELPSQYIKIEKLANKSVAITIDVPPEYLKQLVGGTITYWEYYVYYPTARAPVYERWIIDILTTVTPPVVPEPTILPLIILAALVAILLFIKRK